ncbi:MAG TPA: hypothetical protein PLO93_08075 [Candidatus Omnitrophota bacterium]|nr:hypothetical protein [Candidatus Omnitrophota bacterium]
METQEPEYIFEDTKNADGTTVRVMKTLSGIVVSESVLNSEGREIENKSFDATGNVTGRAVYEQDGQRKPLKVTSYDGKGNLIFTQERGKPPIFYGEHQAGKPPFMCADSQKKS